MTTLDTEEALKALSKLSGRIDDNRRFGVNCAWLLLDRLARGEKLDDAIDAVAMRRHAYVSQDQRYRYTLTREWDVTKPMLTWVMLNPSTADAFADDPTIRRCTNFAKSWGYGGIFVVNLFAYRATSPKALMAASDPVGLHNDITLKNELRGLFVCGWGTHGAFQQRDTYVLKNLLSATSEPMCLGTTMDGHPKHPLYVKGDTQLVPYKPRAT